MPGLHIAGAAPLLGVGPLAGIIHPHPGGAQVVDGPGAVQPDGGDARGQRGGLGLPLHGPVDLPAPGQQLVGNGLGAVGIAPAVIALAHRLVFILGQQGEGHPQPIARRLAQDVFHLPHSAFPSFHLSFSKI